MEAIAKRYFWVIQALGLAIASGLAASALMTALGTRLALAVDEEASAEPAEAAADDGRDEEDPDAEGKVPTTKKPRTASRPNRVSKRHIGDEILARNIFCPT